MEYKKERTFLGTLWSAHRLLAYLGGDASHVRTIDELIEFNRERWEDKLCEGFYPAVMGVIRARTERSPFDMPQSVSDKSSELLRAFVEKVLNEATSYLREHPHRYPTIMEETCEMVDLYRLLLDREKNPAPWRELAVA